MSHGFPRRNVTCGRTADAVKFDQAFRAESDLHGVIADFAMRTTQLVPKGGRKAVSLTPTRKMEPSTRPRRRMHAIVSRPDHQLSGRVGTTVSHLGLPCGLGLLDFWSTESGRVLQAQSRVDPAQSGNERLAARSRSTAVQHEASGCDGNVAGYIDQFQPEKGCSVTRKPRFNIGPTVGRIPAVR